jgi:PEP-CTERM motif
MTFACHKVFIFASATFACVELAFSLTARIAKMILSHKFKIISVSALALIVVTPALAVPVTFTQLTGTTGGVPAATGVFKADLSTLGLGNILSITITDSNSTVGGSGGQFSGFDLDAILLSTVDCPTAACAASAIPLSAFIFANSNVLFSPGTQRLPVDPKLFGTTASGLAVDFSLASLGLFDGNATTGPTAAGFISLGDGGSITFNLSAALSTAGLFLYIGEVGDNGEVAASNITVQNTRVPEPETFGLFTLGCLGLRWAHHRKRR